MRKLLLFFLVAVPALAVQSQSLITVNPQQCVWRTGDNPGWAAPNLDESGWHPYPSSLSRSSESRVWIRCHVDKAGLNKTDHPALQVRLVAAYEAFMNGLSVARNGNLESGNFGMDLIRVFPLPQPLFNSSSDVLALRIVRRYTLLFPIPNSFFLPQIRLGNQQILRNDRAGYIVEQLPGALLNYAPFVVIGIIGVVLLGFSLYDPSRTAPILLSACCIAVGLIFFTLLCAALMVNEPVWLFLESTTIGSATSIASQYCFPFALAGRRLPRAFWLPLGILILFAAWYLVEALVPLSLALPLDAIGNAVISPAYTYTQVPLGAASLVAFWPWKNVPSPMRMIVGFSIAWGVSQSLFFIAVVSDLRLIPGLPDVFHAWMFPASTIAQVFVIAAIIALNLRDQRLVALNRASLAGEMQAASEIQRMLAPAKIDTAPGLRINVAFHPMREVGGDFYLCRVLPDGRQRVLIGDVSGKGAAAAMAATLLLGAAAARDSDSPAVLLVNLNRVLRENHLTGFATCLCADITADGDVRIANAGHLPPYCSGREVELESGLPLGILAEASYSETTLRIAEGDTLTLLSDGVVEARNAAGELFGFDRASAISSQSAEEIVQAAQTHGQEDDITVLTLTLAGAPAHA